MVSTYGLLPCGSALIVATLLIGQSLSCPTNCMNCSNNRTCGRCKDGYYNGHWYDDYQRYPELKNCSLPCHEDCKACTSYKNCTKCKLGFCIDHEERACKTSCNVKHCELCTSCDVCTKCNIWYYGKNCEEICAYGCKDQHCDITNGFCTCRQNFQGDKCDQCISGKYGKNCDKNCAKNCKTNMCDMQSGACVTGCKPGFKPHFCDSCIDGFFRNGGDICEKCPNACLRCTDSNNCLECEPRSWGHKCQHSCPSTCKSCDILGRCKECIQEYYGPSCTDTCQEGCEGNICSKNNGHCPTCKPGYSGYRCSTCEVGFWGQYCNTPCSRGCFEDKCTKDTGLCTNGCKPQFTGHTCGSCEKGYHGEECSPCPRNCEICTSDTLCSMCNAGYWGSRCENNCLDNCKECVSNNECSHCKKGFYGAKCSILCSQNCLDQTCNKITGSCTKCTIGYYGERCEARCPETCAINYCNSDGNCFACAEGYFGVNCSSKCPSNCKGKCQLDGHCRSCIEGYFGNICNKNCPKNCLSCISGTNCKYCKPGFRGNICEHECSNCKPGTKCGQQDGHCEEDCADGLYGPMCGQPCLKECKTCARNLSFKCSSCIHGKYGAYDISGKTDYLTCKLNCSQACLNSSCNEENGRCLQGCVQGFWGALCNSLCPTNCKNGKCLDKEGACAEDCEEGYFGMKCMWACSDYERNCSTCLTDNYGLYNCCIMCKKGHFPTNNPSNRLKYKRCGPCSSNCSRNDCNTTNGFCEYGCKFGLWGSQCEKTCDYNCVGCEQFNGACLNCTDGRHGIKCLENCSLNCGRKNGVPVCSQYDGQCLNKCTHGFHGQFCDMPCSKNCANNTCNKLDGDCSLGCLPGFDGKTCTRVTSGTSRGVIIATCCALVIGFLIFITVVICFKVHSRKRNKSSLEMREQHGHYMNDANQCDVKSRSDMVPGRRREHGNVDDKDVETRIEYANTSNTELFQTIQNLYEVVEIESYEEENFKRAESTQTVCKHYIHNLERSSKKFPYRPIVLKHKTCKYVSSLKLAIFVHSIIHHQRRSICCTNCR